MAFCVERRALILLVLVSVLKSGHSQIICRIEVDSARGWWRDVTEPAVRANEAATYCDGFLYREANLTCTTPLCQPNGIVGSSCTLYYNLEKQWPCLATCNRNCAHGSQCEAAPANCPCQEHYARYNKARMCVPFSKLNTCPEGELNEKGMCIPKSCINACPNGRCSEDRTCSCLDGFTQDPTLRMCVPDECLSACVNGTCDLYGECTCQVGFEKDGSKRYKCNKVNNVTPEYVQSIPQDVCANVECENGICVQGECRCNEGFQKDQGGKCSPINGAPREGRQFAGQSECDRSGCTEANGQCVQDHCRCNDGFTNDPGDKFTCVGIVCPASEPAHFCQRMCQSNGCTEPSGFCDISGECRCEDGYEKDPKDKHKCARIACPAPDSTNYCQRLCQSNGCKESNGWCKLSGECECTFGFKKDPVDKYRCNKVNCPDIEHHAYCQGECLKSGCNATKGRCVQGECTCTEGFKKSARAFGCQPIRCPDPGEAAHCKAECDTRCTNGQCSDRGDCVCNQEHKTDPKDKYVCNTINCPSYEREDDGYCKTQCDAHCNFGVCDKSGFCSCSEGFKKAIKSPYQCDKIDCASEGQDYKGYCAAQCTRYCHNGDCVGGVRCDCRSGFKNTQGKMYECNAINCPANDSDDRAYCKTLCTGGCKNGTCDYRGVCNCIDGFKKSPLNIYQCNVINCPSAGNDDKTYCYSKCRKNCNNGTCDNAGKCTCYYGFKKKLYELYQCKQISCPSSAAEDDGYCSTQCTRYCKNGACDEKGNCRCSDGYKRSSDKYKCKPITCQNLSEAGYCKRECDSRCKENGWCSDDGDCQCNAGYKTDYNDKYVCNKINCPSYASEDYVFCKMKCVAAIKNGNCDSRGGWNCSDGFKKSNALYKCDKIDCASEGQVYKGYCAAQCTQYCHNGDCVGGVRCDCKSGFKKTQGKLYECKEIICPSSVSEDDRYCKTQCDNACKYGACDAKGNCNCNKGFTKLPDELYKCAEINCPSRPGKNVTEWSFCKAVCEPQCIFGECNDLGFCNCSEGYKKTPGEDYYCAKIKCPTTKSEDKAYCKDRCSKTCTNGDCDERGACVCQDAFVPTNRTRVDCHHECHDDESCSLEAILGGIIGGGFAVVVAIIVIAALSIRNRNREERAQKEKEAQEIPLETLAEEPEYVNYGQEAEGEENDLYQALGQRHPGRDRLQ